VAFLVAVLEVPADSVASSVEVPVPAEFFPPCLCRLVALTSVVSLVEELLVVREAAFQSQLEDSVVFSVAALVAQEALVVFWVEVPVLAALCLPFLSHQVD
jgi:hypothetical protein